ncbi:hypothetical protein C8R47DRAFT_1122998 [Mycena vitilis]|nr:hypothetical protein C8R47DRAFT_1122998 [Mycena vitilis]
MHPSASPVFQSPDTATSFEHGICSLIEQSESNIGDIDAEIAYFRYQIEALSSLRELEVEEIAALKAKIAPIRKLPVELLAEIFLLSLVPQSSIYRVFNSEQDVFRLSQVSAHWRQVAHSTPRLWTTPVQMRPSLVDPTEAMTKVWIDRSSPLPISVHVLTGRKLYGRSSPKGYYTRLTSLMRVLLSAAHRWKTLAMAPEVVHYFLPNHPDTFPALEEVRFLTSEYVLNDLDIHIFSTASRLRTFDVRNLKVRDYRTPPTFHMPWTQLETLELSDTAGRATLCLCPNLRHATVTVRQVGVQTTQGFPFLKTLHATFWGTRGTRAALVADAFFTSLAFPALENLTVVMPSFSPERLTIPFTHLQLKSPDIRILTLDGVWLHSTELIDVLRSAPCLTQLGVKRSRSAIDDRLFDALQYHPGVPFLVPTLVNLCLDPSYDSDVYFSSAAASQMVRSRWWTDSQFSYMTALHISLPARLEKLHISHCFETHWQLRYILAECIEQGFILES